MYDLEVDWRGFELHPEVPAGGIPATRLFPADMLEQFEQHLAVVARRFGLDRPLRLGDHLPSSRAALAMTEYARHKELLTPFREAVMAAYWFHGLALEDPGALGQLARQVGLDPDAAREAMDDPKYLDRLDDMRHEASAKGVTGIPTFFFGDAVRVVGCEPLESLARAAERAGARRR